MLRSKSGTWERKPLQKDLSTKDKIGEPKKMIESDASVPVMIGWAAPEREHADE